ncbi:hypothetical protein ANN_27080 [Periplaneta americana]|uniref:Uncharacterized protein n=1 Tax=Periplaneta americana TaxID=6978 RepID=A0ABQ8RX13_PERAM|nr:hypothetical protein ANN_27080 [Periplaneta americana]
MEKLKRKFEPKFQEKVATLESTHDTSRTQGICYHRSNQRYSPDVPGDYKVDLARDRTRNLGHRRPALYQLANQVD